MLIWELQNNVRKISSFFFVFFLRVTASTALFYIQVVLVRWSFIRAVMPVSCHPSVILSRTCVILISSHRGTLSSQDHADLVPYYSITCFNWIAYIPKTLKKTQNRFCLYIKYYFEPDNCVTRKWNNFREPFCVNKQTKTDYFMCNT